MRHLLADVRHASRTLWKAKGFAAVAVLCLGLGIGATATIFGMINAFMLRPFPFRDEGSVVAVYASRPGQGVDEGGLSLADFADWRRESRTLAAIAIYSDGNFNVAGPGNDRPDLVKGAWVSPALFPMLGVHPALGRAFTAEEERPGGDGVVLLSHRLWRRRFGGDPGVIGRPVVVAGRARTIVGVMPAGWNFPQTHDLWLPQTLDPAGEPRGQRGHDAIARLAPGVTMAQAEAELAAIAGRLARAYPQTNGGWSARLTTWRERMVDRYGAILYIFLGVVFFVMFIACANVANLLLARAGARRKEMALRTALGAGRGRIVRQLLTESLLLAVAGGALGVLLSLWGTDVMVAAIPYELPFWMRFDLDWRVLGFAVAVSTASGVAFGLAPALQLSRPDLHEALKDGGRGTTAGRGGGRLRGALVVSEVALSLVLLVGATLMMRSLLALQAADPKFDASRLLTMRLPLSSDAYATPGRRAAYFRRVLGAVRALPGVEGATVVNYVPLEGSNTSTSIEIEGRAAPPGEELDVAYRSVADDYFRALGVPLAAGRPFAAREAAESSAVAVINDVMARRYWPNGDALGRRLRRGEDAPWLTVVGIVPEIRQRELDERPQPQLYLPYPMSPQRTMTLMVRTAGDPAAATAAVRDAVRSVDAGVPVAEAMTMRQLLHRSVWQPRLFGGMFAVFALVALALAAAGVYGVVAYSVSQRTHEFGVRMALGAAGRDVVRLVVRQGARLALVGIALGVLGAAALSGLLRRMLYGIAPTDPLTFAAVPLTLAAVALVASWIPARRATRVDPMEALRSE